MHITVNLLYRDTINFFKQKKLVIFIIIVIASSITITLDNIFDVNINVLKIFYELKNNTHYSIFDLIKTLTPHQQKQLLLSSIIKVFSSLIGTTVLIGLLTIFIKSMSFDKKDFISELKQYNLHIFINLFILMFVITTIIQLGLVLLVIPGIIAFVLLALSPIILILDHKNIIQSIISSIQITLQNFTIICPAIIQWLLSKFVILIFISDIKIFSESILLFFVNIVTNLISSILIIYLFRFYMLSSHKQVLT
ncbi:MAG: YciC family protein [Buchnera aphidicola (Schlechtendalia peitan)]